MDRFEETLVGHIMDEYVKNQEDEPPVDELDAGIYVRMFIGDFIRNEFDKWAKGNCSDIHVKEAPE